MKAETPTNNFGPYLTRLDIDSIDIANVTGIPVSDIRKMRSGEIRAISAKRANLISKYILGIEHFLTNVYPDIKLENTDKPEIDSIKYSELGVSILSLEDNTLKIIAHRTGLDINRLKRLQKLPIDNIETHELYLIELSANIEIGSKFNELFGESKSCNNTLPIKKI